METAIVAELPDCDVHGQMFGVRVPAEFDAPLANVPGQPGAYLCAICLPRWAAVDSGLVQRLVVGGAR